MDVTAEEHLECSLSYSKTSKIFQVALTFRQRMGNNSDCFVLISMGNQIIKQACLREVILESLKSMLLFLVSDSTSLPRCSSPASSSDSNAYESSNSSSGAAKAYLHGGPIYFLHLQVRLIFVCQCDRIQNLWPHVCGDFSMALIELVRLTSNVNSEAGILD